MQVVAAAVAADDEVRVRLRDAVGRQRARAASARSAAPRAARRRSRSTTPGRSGSRGRRGGSPRGPPSRPTAANSAVSTGSSHEARHERDRGEVVDLVRLHLAQRVLERAPVEQVGADELQRGRGSRRGSGSRSSRGGRRRRPRSPCSSSSSARRLPSWPPMPVTRARRVPSRLIRRRIEGHRCASRTPWSSSGTASPAGRRSRRSRRPGGCASGTGSSSSASSAWHRRASAEPPWRPPISVRRLPGAAARALREWHRLRRPHVERATGPVDVIHATGVAVPPRTAPLVVTVHDLSYLVYPEHFSAQGRRFFRQALELTRQRRRPRAVLLRGDAPSTARRPASTPERLRVVPLGADVAPRPRTTWRASARRTASKRPYVLWVGTLEPRKNLPRLLEAFAAARHRGRARARRPARLEPGARPAAAARDCSASCPATTCRRSTPARPRSASRACSRASACRSSTRWRRGRPWSPRRGRRPRRSPATRASSSTRTTSTRSRAHSSASCATPRWRQRLGEAGRARAATYTWERTAALTAEAYAEVAGR